MSNETDPKYLALADIKVDQACQARAAMDNDTINDYVEIMKEENDDPFPPVVVFYDGTEYWLADGFHRRAAAERIGLLSLKVEVRQGSQRDAILHAVGANTTHGLRRSSDDKRRAVEMLLADPEWVNWSDAEIAKYCNVSDRFVSKQRRHTPNRSESTVRKYTNPKTGQTTEMDISNIGRRVTKSPEVLVSSPDNTVRPGEGSDPLKAAPDLVEGSHKHPEAQISVPETNADNETAAHLDALLIAWERAGTETRAQFLELIEAVPLDRLTEDQPAALIAREAA